MYIVSKGKMQLKSSKGGGRRHSGEEEGTEERTSGDRQVRRYPHTSLVPINL